MRIDAIYVIPMRLCVTLFIDFLEFIHIAGFGIVTFALLVGGALTAVSCVCLFICQACISSILFSWSLRTSRPFLLYVGDCELTEETILAGYCKLTQERLLYM